MCVLILLHRVVPDFPVVLAANRDERYDRPASPPRRVEAALPYVAPHDLRTGGTWIGTNDAGLVAAVTNRHAAKDDPSRPSRGGLVPEALAAGNVTGARVRVERLLREVRPNGFHLLYADAHDASVTRGADPIETIRLPPGLHVITNDHELGEIDLLEADRIAAAAPAQSLLETVGALVELLKERDPVAAGGYAPNKDRGDRGTVSSTVIARAEPGRATGLFLHAEGPPHRTLHRDHSSLLRR
ncbi:MAG: NRDE family protein [Planctomycetota bacterium JB042]